MYLNTVFKYKVFKYCPTLGIPIGNDSILFSENLTKLSQLCGGYRLHPYGHTQ